MSENLPAVSVERAGEVMEAVIAKGDLSQLGPNDRARYYRTVCDSIGLNPLTKPFEYITLNGKLTLYARKDATDQLRKIYGVSVIDMTETREEGLVIVTVKVRDNTGRTDMAKGAVSLKSLSGEALANAFMKCETKAKRRATLSICGLGFLDETEVETISNAQTPRLPKKDARDIYTRMQTEVDEAADVEDWLLKNEGRLLVLPTDWENILRLRIQERQQTPPAAEEPTVLMADEDQTPPEWSGSKWDALGPVKQAGILCADKAFQKFMEVVSEDAAIACVRARCDIDSRRELATDDEAAREWRRIVADYRAWQREPAVTNEVAPRQQGQRAADDQGAPVESPGAAGVPEVPLSLEDEARAAARKGEATFNTFWKNLEKHERDRLKTIGDELRHMLDDAKVP